MRILVVGGNGFIGRRIGNHSLKKFWPILCWLYCSYLRPSTGHRRLSLFSRHWLPHGKQNASSLCVKQELDCIETDVRKFEVMS